MQIYKAQLDYSVILFLVIGISVIGYFIDMEALSIIILNIPFEGFLSIKYGAKTIEENIELGLQKGMVIFAINAIGTLFFISMLTESFGMIYSKRSNSEELRMHCESFSQFLEGLNYIKVKYKLL